MHSARARAALALAVASIALAACGGGGGDDGDGTSEPVAGTIPASATASVPSLLAYLRELIAGTNDTDAPVSLGDAVLPTDDNAEPSAVN